MVKIMKKMNLKGNLKKISKFPKKTKDMPMKMTAKKMTEMKDKMKMMEDMEKKYKMSRSMKSKKSHYGK